MRCLALACCASMLFATSTAQAQLGRLVKEGAEVVGKKVLGRGTSAASRESAEQVLKKAGSVTIRQVGKETAEAAISTTGKIVASQSDDVLRAVGKHGSAIAAPLVKGFGDDGAKALVKLSPDNARRMAILADDLAIGGRGKDWMRILADKGDVAAEWVWKNKGTIAVATTATAFLANPEPFLETGGVVIGKSIETAGEHVARPLIEQSVGSVGKIGAAVATATLGSPWIVVASLVGLCGVGLVAYRWNIRPWLRIFRKR